MAAPDEGEKEVCYGRLERTKVNAHQIPFPDPKAIHLSKIEWPSIKLKLRRYPGKNMIICVCDAAGKDFGNADIKTALGLAPLLDTNPPMVRTQARLTNRKKNPHDLPGQGCSETYDMTVNLYGKKKNAQKVGRHLSQKQLYLRMPFGVERGFEVFNPHQLAPNIPKILPRTSMAGSHGSGFTTRTPEEIRLEVTGMFDSLQKSLNLPEMEPDQRVITPLLSHQKQALFFMTAREHSKGFSEDEDTTSLWRLHHKANGRKVYVNIITGHEEREEPPPVLGGILADMMGLGKTLSILSLVVGSLNESKSFAKHAPLELSLNGKHQDLKNTKTTLLVAPLSTIANWEEQILAHIKDGTLSVYVYHGNNRIQDVNVLATYDLVITTYAVVSSDFAGRKKSTNKESPLMLTKFFRIVLDEGHAIREQSTRQSQAIRALAANRRWAVTGTPVQNRLDDLGALIKFLRIKPFHEDASFTQFVLKPFKDADPEIIPKLRILVDTITLRRLKDRIDLPARQDQVVRLNFSEEEQQLYSWFKHQADAKMGLIAKEGSKNLGGRGYVHVLQAILRLRLICAHGKELLGEDDLKLTEGMTSANSIDLDDENSQDQGANPALTNRQAYDMLMLNRETNSDTCASCLKRVEPKDRDDEVEGDETIGYMLPCFQMMCESCSKGVESTIESSLLPNGTYLCPFCTAPNRNNMVPLTQQGIENAEEQKALAKENPKQAKIMGRYGGPHTKTQALLIDLNNSLIESAAHPEEPPIKSVVFSGWTSHLDLIQIALEDAGMKYVRLDGKMSRKNRNASLDAFRENPSVRVIIVSIQAGGLGLNLTTGSKVYIMEPLFNPAAEAQAIDRVHRLGQKRPVVATRFIMADSFEEKMLALQKKKKDLADISMAKGKLDKTEAMKAKLEELRGLFK